MRTCKRWWVDGQVVPLSRYEGGRVQQGGKHAPWSLCRVWLAVSVPSVGLGKVAHESSCPYVQLGGSMDEETYDMMLDYGFSNYELDQLAERMEDGPQDTE